MTINNLYAMGTQKSRFYDICSELPIYRDRRGRLSSNENLYQRWVIGKCVHLSINKLGQDETLVIKAISEYLQETCGYHYGPKDLKKMERFFFHYPTLELVNSLSIRITWSHINELSAIDNGLSYNLYADICINERWTSSCLHNNIEVLKSLNAKMRLFFEESNSALALVRVDNDNKYFNWALLHRELHRMVTVVLIIGKFNAVYLNQIELYLQHLNETERKEGEKAPLGLILCVDENSTSVKLFQLDIVGMKEIDYPEDFPSKSTIESKLRICFQSKKKRFENHT